MSSATLRDALEKAHDPAANAVADLREHGEQARDTQAGHGGELKGRMGEFMEQARGSARQIGDRATHAYGIARQRTTAGAQNAWGYVRAHPGLSIGIAAGVGALIGGLLFSSKRSAKRRREQSRNHWFRW